MPANRRVVSPHEKARTAGITVGLLTAAAALAVPWWPVGLSVLVTAVTVCAAWPPMAQFPPPAATGKAGTVTQEAQLREIDKRWLAAAKAKGYLVALGKPGAALRLGPHPGCAEQASGALTAEMPEPRKKRRGEAEDDDDASAGVPASDIRRGLPLPPLPARPDDAPPEPEADLGGGDSRRGLMRFLGLPRLWKRRPASDSVEEPLELAGLPPGLARELPPEMVRELAAEMSGAPLGSSCSPAAKPPRLARMWMAVRKRLRRGEPERPTRWRPLSYSALGALAVAVLAAAAELACSRLSAQLADAVWEAPESVRQHLGLGPKHLVVTVPVSALAGWWGAQAAATVRREWLFGPPPLNPGGAPPAGVAPPGERFALLRVVWRTKGPKAAVSGILAAASSSVGAWIAAPRIGWAAAAAVALTGSGAATLGPALKADAARQRADWKERADERENWRQIWGSLGGVHRPENAPIWQRQVDLPEDADEPDFRWITFAMIPGRDFADYADKASKVAHGVGRQLMVIEPLMDSSTSRAHTSAFSLTHELRDLGADPHLNPSLHPLTHRFATRWAVVEAFAGLGLPTPQFLGCARITERGRPQITESKWGLPGGVTASKVMGLVPKLAEKLRCEWCRVHAESGDDQIVLWHGVPPHKTELARSGARAKRALIDKVNWAYLMTFNRVLGRDGRPPELVGSRRERGLEIHTFTLPMGVSLEQVRKKAPELAAAAGVGHLEAESADDPSHIRVITGDSDPLDDVYLWHDWKHLLVGEPVRGDPRIDWIVGIGADGDPVRFVWDGEEPHLLVAGMSGYGKSVLINSMLLQIMAGSHPDDVEFWMLEPKIELQQFQHQAHVRYFIDNGLTDVTPWEYGARLLDAALAEMNRRYRAMRTHPLNPLKLPDARAIARDDPKGSGHLMFPYIFVLIEECASFFQRPDAAAAAGKENRESHGRMINNVNELARISRSAGIHIIIVTQYPVKENLPMTLKQQCRRVGLRTTDHTSSMVVLGAKGLEDIRSPGRGIMTAPGGWKHYRAFWLEHEADGRKVNDRAELLRQLPHDGRWPKLPDSVEASEMALLSAEHATAHLSDPGPPVPVPPPPSRLRRQ